MRRRPWRSSSRLCLRIPSSAPRCLPVPRPCAILVAVEHVYPYAPSLLAWPTDTQVSPACVFFACVGGDVCVVVCAVCVCVCVCECTRVDVRMCKLHVGQQHPIVVVVFMVGASLALLIITLKWPPFFGPGCLPEGAEVVTSRPNRLRVMIDLLLLYLLL